jgi:hypothetical protein
MPPQASVLRPGETPTDWWLASWNNLMEAQRFWLTAILPWQQGLLAAQRDLWDQWRAQWAGGVPIDG